MTDMDTPPRRSRGHLTRGTILVVLGSWLFLQNLGVDLPGLEEMWPILPTLAGAALLVSFLTGKDRSPGLVFVGTAALLVGLFFFAFTLGPLGWERMDVYWPALTTHRRTGLPGDLDSGAISRIGSPGAGRAQRRGRRRRLRLYPGVGRGVGAAGDRGWLAAGVDRDRPAHRLPRRRSQADGLSGRGASSYAVANASAMLVSASSTNCLDVATFMRIRPDPPRP